MVINELNRVKREMKAGISACSNGRSRKSEKDYEELMAVLRKSGAEPVPAPHIYARTDKFSGSDEESGPIPPSATAILMRFPLPTS